MSNLPLATIPPVQEEVSQRGGAFSSIQKFEDAQRMAKVLCASSIVPQSYRDNLADCVIALEMSNRIGANPLAVMQNLYIVHGKPAWSSQFLISCVNASGKFSPLRYRETGTIGQDDWGCVAWAQDKTGERLESPEVTLGMAKAEGWYSKNGSKWKTMPQLMLRYRAATLFARLFAPELTMGIQCDDEVIDVFPVVTEPVKTLKNANALFKKPEPAAIDLPPVESSKPATVAETVSPSAQSNAPAAVMSAPVAENETPKQFVVRMLTDAAVPFDDLRDYITTKNISKDADSWAGFDMIPGPVFEALAVAKTLANIIKLYGKKSA